MVADLTPDADAIQILAFIQVRLKIFFYYLNTLYISSFDM